MKKQSRFVEKNIYIQPRGSRLRCTCGNMRAAGESFILGEYVHGKWKRISDFCLIEPKCVGSEIDWLRSFRELNPSRAIVVRARSGHTLPKEIYQRFEDVNLIVPLNSNYMKMKDILDLIKRGPIMSVYVARLNPDDDSGDDLVSITMSAKSMGLLLHTLDCSFAWELSKEAGDLAKQIFLELARISVRPTYCDIYPRYNSAERYDAASQSYVLNDQPPRALNRQNEIIAKNALDEKYGPAVPPVNEVEVDS